MKEWACVEVDHHRRIAKAIEDMQEKGWRPNTYQAAGTPTIINHYLLFEREKSH